MVHQNIDFLTKVRISDDWTLKGHSPMFQFHSKAMKDVTTLQSKICSSAKNSLVSKPNQHDMMIALKEKSGMRCSVLRCQLSNLKEAWSELSYHIPSAKPHSIHFISRVGFDSKFNSAWYFRYFSYGRYGCSVWIGGPLMMCVCRQLLLVMWMGQFCP